MSQIETETESETISKSYTIVTRSFPKLYEWIDIQKRPSLASEIEGDILFVVEWWPIKDLIFVERWSVTKLKIILRIWDMDLVQ